MATVDAPRITRPFVSNGSLAKTYAEAEQRHALPSSAGSGVIPNTGPGQRWDFSLRLMRLTPEGQPVTRRVLDCELLLTPGA
jgi:hypothetical protein